MSSVLSTLNFYKEATISDYFIIDRDHVSQRMDYGELTNFVFSHYAERWKGFARYVTQLYFLLAVRINSHIWQGNCEQHVAAAFVYQIYNSFGVYNKLRYCN